MRISVVVLSFVLLQAGSNAAPIWPSKASSLADPSLSLPESSLTAEQLADEKYKNQKMAEFTESILRQLLDKHDIVPEEHEWGSSKCPFNPDEYYTLTLPEAKKNGWKKFWEGIRGLFSPSDKTIGACAEVMTTDGTDGTVKGDMEPLSENDTDNWKASKEKIGSGWSGISDVKNSYTMHGAKGFR
ncbi:hypothetical protein B9Z19DRAFT_1135509 [Tuber borchii]|uniref:Uncharacterized protein n=1 Tax=Tuber borchii TaxID=42251 RepID=A0A2T6ZCR8_TUBBO|nr:hypothetical protein B9Z19DRAFT_1135509 [Tuber borchii]